MKKLSKTIFSIAAVAAVSAVMATSALAMKASYDAGVVTLSEVTATGNSQTLLILSEDAKTITEDNKEIIKQIDQKDDGASFATVKVGTLDNGTYFIRVGGSDGTLQTAEFTVGSAPVETETIVIGDTNNDGAVGSADVGQVARRANGYTSIVGKAGQTRTVAADNTTIVIGDTNNDGAVGSADVGQVARRANGYTSIVGKAGQTVEVVK